ncbi:MAG: sigma-54-dependent Fis family transcriptional regulator, partial [Nitrospirae bacterium]
MNRERILIVDDEPGVRHFLKKVLSRDYAVETAADGEAALAAVAQAPPAAILLDWKLPGLAGVELLQRLREAVPEAAVVVITAFGDTDTAIQVIEAGAFDYLTKPLDLDTVREVVARGIRTAHPERGGEIQAVEPGERLRGDRLIGNAPAMVAVYKQIAQVAKLDVTVLIRGDSGTGKELVARTLHRYSRRAGGPFVAVNCAAIPETLLESELFGYAPGAFTGADRRGRPGRFEQAAGGTLFLDEVGDMEL